MAKTKKERGVNYYDKKLREMICERREVDKVESWLESSIHTAAMCWAMMEKVHEEIMSSDLTQIETGSMGQTKVVANPLISMYKEMQRTMLLHHEALGLNFKTAPKRMTDPAAQSGHGKNDNMTEFFEVTR